MDPNTSERVNTLIETLDVLHESLDDCLPNELHVAVRVIGRVLNVFQASFEFSTTVDSMINPTLNGLLIRHWSKEPSHLAKVKDCEQEIIRSMKSCLVKRLA